MAIAPSPLESGEDGGQPCGGNQESTQQLTWEDALGFFSRCEIPSRRLLAGPRLDAVGALSTSAHIAQLPASTPVSLVAASPGSSWKCWGINHPAAPGGALTQWPMGVGAEMSQIPLHVRKTSDV